MNTRGIIPTHITTPHGIRLAGIHALYRLHIPTGEEDIIHTTGIEDTGTTIIEVPDLLPEDPEQDASRAESNVRAAVWLRRETPEAGVRQLRLADAQPSQMAAGVRRVTLAQAPATQTPDAPESTLQSNPSKLTRTQIRVVHRKQQDLPHDRTEAANKRRAAPEEADRAMETKHREILMPFPAEPVHRLHTVNETLTSGLLPTETILFRAYEQRHRHTERHPDTPPHDTLAVGVVRHR